MASANSSPLVVAASTVHTHTIVFLHGRGGTAASLCSSLGDCLTSLGQSILETFPSVRWVFPRAPLAHPSAHPKDLVPQWFDIWNVRDFEDREDLQAVGLRESVRNITALLQDDVALLDGRWDKLALAGISQGAATAVHTLINLNIPSTPLGHPGHLGALVVFSCRMPFPNRTLSDTRAILGLKESPSHSDALELTPILLEHCRNDEKTPISRAMTLRKTLQTFGATVVWKEYVDGGHWFHTPEGMDDLVSFLREKVPGLKETSDERRD